MKGAIIITHGGLAEALLKTAEGIVGHAENVCAIGVNSCDTMEEIRERLNEALKEVDKNEGVLVFTDMFGGTPTNAALSFFCEGKVEIITGVNLPMLLKFLNSRADHVLKELVSYLVEHVKRSVLPASEILKRGG